MSAVLPARSETFVYREIRELRRRGWRVVCVSLHEPQESIPGLSDIEFGRIVVYDSIPTLLGRSAAESLRHPIRRMASSWMVLRDIFNPAEPCDAATRWKLPGQSIAATALAPVLRSAGVRHIHCHFAHAPTTIGMYAARQLGVSFSFTGHANDLFQRRALLRRKLQRAAFVNCISEWHRDFYVGIEPACAPRCHIVRCGVDVEGWFAQPSAAPSPAGTPLRIVSVCRLIEKKGLDTLLRALGRLAGSGLSFTLTIAGDGPQRRQLESIAREERIFPSVKFLGSVENEQVPALLREADAFALPCRQDSSGDRDGIPVVLMEAMACGLPVISGDLPAIRELVKHEHNGLLVNGLEPQSVAEAIERLARDPELRRRLGQSGRQRVMEEVSLGENVSRLERLLRETISTGSADVPITSADRAAMPSGHEVA
ncbi:MAG: glycosyltransferase family 4 protein [Phycisphaerae bacterium]|nr:glycosyltransferase family 4 protein [Phycisphaerae bacterium]